MGSPADDDKRKGSVNQIEVSLSQAVLSPLDALFKAQIHAARSFLSLLLQVGYPSTEEREKRNEDTSKPGRPYMLEFPYTAIDPVDKTPKEYKLKIPAMALVPLNALAIENAEYKFALRVTSVFEHQQGQDPGKRPWYLIEEPLSLRGHVAAQTNEKSSTDTLIDIQIKVGKSPMPAALDKLLATLSQAVTMEDMNGKK